MEYVVLRRAGCRRMPMQVLASCARVLARRCTVGRVARLAVWQQPRRILRAFRRSAWAAGSLVSTMLENGRGLTVSNLAAPGSEEITWIFA